MTKQTNAQIVHALYCLVIWQFNVIDASTGRISTTSSCWENLESKWQKKYSKHSAYTKCALKRQQSILDVDK